MIEVHISWQRQLDSICLFLLMHNLIWVWACSAIASIARIAYLFRCIYGTVLRHIYLIRNFIYIHLLEN